MNPLHLADATVVLLQALPALTIAPMALVPLVVLVLLQVQLTRFSALIGRSICGAARPGVALSPLCSTVSIARPLVCVLFVLVMATTTFLRLLLIFYRRSGCSHAPSFPLL